MQHLICNSDGYVVVANQDIVSVEADNSTPVWSSPAAGANVSSSSTITLSATDIDGDTLTYSIVSGTLPSGLTLSGSTISGTSTAPVGSTSTITVRVSDGELYADRTFNIVKTLYAFTSHTFTNAGATGRYGPTLTQLRNAYTPSWTDDTNYLNVVTQGIQQWTVPETGTYEIEVAGAAGATPTSTSFRGIKISNTFTLTAGNKINIIVGQQGSIYQNLSAGGGGGSYVFVNATDSQPLIVAGGGGGLNDYKDNPYTGSNLPATNGQSGTSGGNNVVNLYGGTNGNGGVGGNWAGGGAGWLTDGADGGDQLDGGGHAPRNGAVGGWSYRQAAWGGFGGGGGVHGDTGGGGGGGGYSGGGGIGSLNGGWAGGGGSYGGTATGNYSSSHGYVTITKI